MHVKNLRYMWKYTFLYVNEDPFSEIFQPMPPAMRTYDTDGLEVILNHLKEKSYRYNSQRLSISLY